MAAAYVGTFGGAETSSFGFTVGWVTTREIVAGEHVVVVSANRELASVTVGALSLAEDFEISNGEIRVWSARATGTITIGSTVTLTKSSESTGLTGVGEVLSGVATSSWLGDTAETISGFGGSPATGTTDGTPAVDDLAMAFVLATGDVTAVDSGFTFGGDDGTNPWGFGSTSGALQAATKTLTAGGATSANFTQSPSGDYHAGIVVFKSGAVQTGGLARVDWSRFPRPVLRSRV